MTRPISNPDDAFTSGYRVAAGFLLNGDRFVESMRRMYDAGDPGETAFGEGVLAALDDWEAKHPVSARKKV